MPFFQQTSNSMTFSTKAPGGSDVSQTFTKQQQHQNLEQAWMQSKHQTSSSSEQKSCKFAMCNVKWIFDPKFWHPTSKFGIQYTHCYAQCKMVFWPRISNFDIHYQNFTSNIKIQPQTLRFQVHCQNSGSNLKC